MESKVKVENKVKEITLEEKKKHIKVLMNKHRGLFARLAKQ